MHPDRMERDFAACMVPAVLMIDSFCGIKHISKRILLEKNSAAPEARTIQYIGMELSFVGNVLKIRNSVGINDSKSRAAREAGKEKNTAYVPDNALHELILRLVKVEK
jgi:hypothetical protein